MGIIKMTKNSLTLIITALVINSSVFPQDKESYRWEKVMIGGGGAVPAIIAHPRVSGCVFSTHDVTGPNRWNETRQQFEYALSFPYWNYPQSIAGCECLTLDPNDPQGNTALLTITNQAGFNKESYMLRTTNRGLTWEYTNFRPIAGSEQFNARYHIQYDPNNSNIVYYAARNGGIYQSSDGGMNFTKTTAPDGSVNALERPKANTGIRKIIINPYLGVVVNPVRSRVLYAEVASQDWNNTMIESTDGGLTWHPISMPASPKFEVGPSGRVYTAGTNKTGYWENNKFNPFPVSGNSISVDPSDENRMVIYKNLGGDKYEFYYSEDRGLSWKMLKPTYVNYPPWYRNQGGCTAPQGGCSNPVDGSFTFDADGRLWYSDWYQIWRCDTLTSQSASIVFYGAVKGEEETVNTGDGLASPWGGNCKVMIGVADVGGFAITNLTRWPEKTALQPDHNIVGLEWAGQVPNKLVFVAAKGWGWDHVGWGGYSEDGGLTTRYFKSRPGNGNMTCSRVAINATGDRIFWYCSTGLYYSDNKGDSWIKASDLSFGYESIFDWKGYHAITADRFNHNLIYLNNNDKLYRSDVKGITWKMVYSKRIGSLYVNPEAEGEIWATGWDSKGGQIIRSIDKGVNFTIITSATEVKSAGFGRGPAKGQPSIYMIGKANGIPGIYRSDNFGTSWIRIDDIHHFPHPSVGNFIAGDGQEYGRVYVGSYGGTWVGASLTQCDTCLISNQPPVVAISEPTKTMWPMQTAFDVKVTANDPNDSIRRVELYLDMEKIGADTLVPFLFRIEGLKPGKYNLTAKAWDYYDTCTSAFLGLVIADSSLVARASFTPEGILIDGFMDKGYSNTPQEVNKKIITGNKNISALWNSCWRDSSWHIWMAEKNVTLSPKSLISWQNDLIELTLLPDINFTHNNAKEKILIYPVDSTILHIMGTDTIPSKSPLAVIITDEGFNTELTVDDENFGFIPAGRNYTGMELRIRDCEETDTSFSLIAWNSNDTSQLEDKLGLVFFEPLNQNPFVRITAPFNNRVYTSTPLLISIFAEATDNDGMVIRVDFYASDSLIGTDYSSPFSIGNSSLGNGNYELKAVAWDNEGGSCTSGLTNITVSISTGIEQSMHAGEIEIYPNPCAIGYFMLSEIADVQITDIAGNILAFQKNTDKVNTDGLAHGIYLVKINNIAVQKLLVN